MLPSLQSRGHRSRYRVPHRLQTVTLRRRKTLSPRGAVQHQKESPGPPPDHEAVREVALNKHLPAGTGDLGGFQEPLLATTGCKVNTWSAEDWPPPPAPPTGVGCASQQAGPQHHFHPCHKTGRVRAPRAAAKGTRGKVASQQASKQLSRKKLSLWERFQLAPMPNPDMQGAGIHLIASLFLQGQEPTSSCLLTARERDARVHVTRLRACMETARSPWWHFHILVRVTANFLFTRPTNSLFLPFPASCFNFLFSLLATISADNGPRQQSVKNSSYLPSPDP